MLKTEVKELRNDLTRSIKSTKKI